MKKNMSKGEWIFLAVFLYLSILATLAIIYWLDGGLESILLTVNYLMVSLPLLAYGVHLTALSLPRRGMPHRFLRAAAGVLISLLGGALLVHTVILWFR
jgi:hypothetical protein